MKVIFLDIDGVLCVSPAGRDEFGRRFNKYFVKNLSKLITETKADIVISSSWRADGLEELRRMWIKRKLPGNVIDVTPLSISRHRGSEIDQWLKDNQIDSYIIIDDDADMLDYQIPYLIQCQYSTDSDSLWGFGLTKSLTEKAIKLLND